MVSCVSRVVKHKQKFWMIFASVFAIAWTSYWFKKHCSMPRGYQSDFQTVKLLLLCFCFLQSWSESANIQNKLFRASSISWIIWTKEVLCCIFCEPAMMASSIDIWISNYKSQNGLSSGFDWNVLCYVRKLWHGAKRSWFDSNSFWMLHPSFGKRW